MIRDFVMKGRFFPLFLIHETGENWAENGLIYDDAIVEND